MAATAAPRWRIMDRQVYHQDPSDPAGPSHGSAVPASTGQPQSSPLSGTVTWPGLIRKLARPRAPRSDLSRTAPLWQWLKNPTGMRPHPGVSGVKRHGTCHRERTGKYSQRNQRKKRRVQGSSQLRHIKGNRPIKLSPGTLLSREMAVTSSPRHSYVPRKRLRSRGSAECE